MTSPSVVSYLDMCIENTVEQTDKAANDISEKIISIYGSSFLTGAVREALKNSRIHNPQVAHIDIQLYEENKSIICKINDHGTYFKNKQIKYLWENRKDPPVHEDTNHFLGHIIMYLQTTRIHVDKDSGALYLIKQIP